MTPQRFAFEGEQLTVAEIRTRVPALSDSSIRKHLAAGRNTRAAMLNFDPRSAVRANGRKAAARAIATGKAPKLYRRKASSQGA
jgi:hypothetical protein